jgi:hypothetical protein
MFATAPAGAAVFVLTGTLSGTQENPVNASPGTGTAIVTLDDTLKTLRVQTTFSGLLGTTTASHIHCCAPAGANAGVATQTPTFSGFPLGVTSGSYDQTFDMNMSSSWNAAFITANGGTIASAFAAFESGLLAERAYLNIHTTQFGGGEIRAQLVPPLAAVPEPATWALTIVGFGLAGGSLRRRRRMAVSYA